MEPWPPIDNVVFDMLQKDLSSTVLLHMTSVMMQAVKATWEHPSSAPVSFKSLNHMYRIEESLAYFLLTHCQSNSLVVSSLAKSRKQQFSPTDKEDKCIESFGWIFYSTGSLHIKGCNYLICMACYIHAILEDFSALSLFCWRTKNSAPCSSDLMVSQPLNSKYLHQSMF